MSIYFMGNNRNVIVVGRVYSETKAKFCLKFIVSSKDANAAGVKNVTFWQTRENSTSIKFDIDSYITGVTGTIKTLWR